MKVLITGAYSTGKTLLVNGLKRRLENHGIPAFSLSDSSREIPFPLNRNQGHDTTLWLLSWQISKELTAERLNTPESIIICDRGVPDILAHNLEACTRAQGLKSNVALDAGTSWCSSYNLSFMSLIDNTIPILQDGLRDPDPKYRHRMEAFARETVAPLNPCLTLPLGLEDRLEYSLNEIIKHRNSS